MEKTFKYILPALLIIGTGFIFTEDLKILGLIFIGILTPVLLLHYLRFFNNQVLTENTLLRFRAPLLFSITVSTYFSLFRLLFKIMQWPFAGPMNVIALVVTFVTTLIACIYIVLNRAHLNRIAYEFIILLTPITISFILLWNSMSFDINKYALKVNEHYLTLTEIQQEIKKKSLSTNDSTDALYTSIEELKTELIVSTGGYLEDGSILGWKNVSTPKLMLTKKSELINQIDTSTIISKQHKKDFQSSKSVIEYLISLTKIQIDLLLHKKES